MVKKHIPKNFRKEYIPRWNGECQRLYDEFVDNGDAEIADKLLHSLDAAKG